MVFLLFLNKLRLELLPLAQDLFTILPECGVACSTFYRKQQRGGVSGTVVTALPVSLAWLLWLYLNNASEEELEEEGV